MALGFRLAAAARGLAGDETVGHDEEVAGELGGEVGEADEDGVVVLVVGWAVVEGGRLGEEVGAVGAVDAEEEGVGLGLFVGGDAGHHFAADLEGGRAEGGGLLDVGEAEGGGEEVGDGNGHGDRVGQQVRGADYRSLRLARMESSPSSGGRSDPGADVVAVAGWGSWMRSPGLGCVHFLEGQGRAGLATLIGLGP